MKLPSGEGIVKFLESPAGLAVAVVGGGLVLYLAYKAISKTASAAAGAAAGLVSGNNAITANQTTWSGQSTNAYEGKGVAGTLGAAANSASGGALASIGNWVGGALYNLFGSNPNPNGGTNNASGTGSNVAGTGNGSTGATNPSQVDFGLIDSSSSGW